MGSWEYFLHALSWGTETAVDGLSGRRNCILFFSPYFSETVRKRARSRYFIKTPRKNCCGHLIYDEQHILVVDDSRKVQDRKTDRGCVETFDWISKNTSLTLGYVYFFSMAFQWILPKG